MVAVDFDEWAADDLELTYRGRTFTVAPPTVGDWKILAAAAVRFEIEFGLVKAEMPAEMQATLTSLGPDAHPALGATHAVMVEAGVPKIYIDKFSYYAIWFWARGRTYADLMAQAMWTPRAIDHPTAGGGGDAPKDSSRPRTGHRSASASPTPKAGTPITGRSPKTSGRKRKPRPKQRNRKRG